MNDRTTADIQAEITEALANGASQFDQEVTDLVRQYQQADRLGF